MRGLPELDRSAAWKVHEALTTATLCEWTKFTKNSSKDTFHSASQSSQKAGSRNAQYARVSELPPHEKSSCHSLGFSTRLMIRLCFNRGTNTAHPSHTTDGSSTSYRSHFPKGMKRFTFTKERLSRSRCFTRAFSHKRTRGWIASTSIFIRKWTRLFKSPTYCVSMALSVGSKMGRTPGQSLTGAEGSLEKRT